MQGDKEEILRAAGEALGKYYSNLKQLRARPTSSDAMRSPEDCEAEIEAWRAKGVADGDRIFSYDFNDHEKAKDNRIALADMAAICAEYRPLHARYKVDYDLRQAEGILMRIRDGFAKPEEAWLTAQAITDYERAGDPQACRTTLAAARKIDPAMRVGQQQLSLDAFEDAVAKPLADVVPKWVAAARAALRARNEKVAAPYVAAGITGQKLDLIVAYAEVYWRLPGGERTDDAKKLAKASVMFQWLEAADRFDPRYVVHTIRRYQFRGDMLDGVSEQRVRRPKGADVLDLFK